MASPRRRSRSPPRSRSRSPPRSPPPESDSEPAIRAVFEYAMNTAQGRRGPVISPPHPDFNSFGDRITTRKEFDRLCDPMKMEEEVWKLCRLHGIRVDVSEVTSAGMYYPRFGGHCTVYLIDPAVAKTKGVPVNTDVNLQPHSVRGPCIVMSEELVHMFGHFDQILDHLTTAVDMKDEKREDPHFLHNSEDTYKREISLSLRDLEVACIEWQETYYPCVMDYARIERLFEASYDAPAVETGVPHAFV